MASKSIVRTTKSAKADLQCTAWRTGCERRISAFYVIESLGASFVLLINELWFAYGKCMRSPCNHFFMVLKDETERMRRTIMLRKVVSWAESSGLGGFGMYFVCHFVCAFVVRHSTLHHERTGREVWRGAFPHRHNFSLVLQNWVINRSTVEKICHCPTVFALPCYSISYIVVFKNHEYGGKEMPRVACKKCRISVSLAILHPSFRSPSRRCHACDACSPGR